MIPPEQIEGKAALFVEFEDRLTILDTLIFCRFYRDFYTWDQLEEIVHTISGLEAGKDFLKEIAGNVANLVRRFNLREGMTPEDEKLPRALYRELKDSGKVITEEEMNTMMKEYYQLHGWGKDFA